MDVLLVNIMIEEQESITTQQEQLYIMTARVMHILFLRDQKDLKEWGDN